MLYDKSIDIMSYTEGYKDNYGIWHNGTSLVGKTIECDVQPITKEIAFRDFGIEEKVKYRIFSDLDESIKVNATIQFKGVAYRVINIIEWDYLDFIVGDL